MFCHRKNSVSLGVTAHADGCSAGKTTFIRMLHGSVKADDEEAEIPGFNVSYKPQKISPKFPGSVGLPISSLASI